MKKKINGTYLTWSFISALFIFITVLYTYPLAFNMSSLFPGEGQSDTTLSIWNIWHLKKTIFTTHNFFAFNTDYILYPQKPSLLLHNYTITTGLMSLPFQYFFEPIVSRNIIFFIEFALTGLGMYFLVLYLVNSRIAALWAGVALAFCPYVINTGFNQLHFSAIWFLPWFIYAFWKFMDSGRLKYSVLSGVIFALCLLNDQTYFIFLAVLLLFVLAFFFLHKRNLPFSAYMRNSLIGFGVFLILALPYSAASFNKILSTQGTVQVWPDAAIDFFSLHIKNLLKPCPILSVYRGLPYLCLSEASANMTNAFIGYVPLFFAIFALLSPKDIIEKKRGKVIGFWILAGAIFFLISLGPLPFGKGSPLNKFSLYNLLCSGFLRQLRIPIRFSLITIMAVYILAAFGIERFVRLNKGKFLSNAGLGVFLIAMQAVEFLPVPYPLLNLQVPQIYYKLALQDKNSPILILPLGWQTSYKTIGGYDKRIQFYQTIHEHPIFQGQVARIEDSYFDYYLSQGGFKYLIKADRMMPDAADRSGVLDILKKYGIKQVVIHRLFFDKEHLNALLSVFKDYPGGLSVGFAE